MSGKNTAVFGMYRDRTQAEDAVDALRAAGFRNSDVSALLPDNMGSKDLGQEKNSKAPEGVAGGALGWLAGIGALAIPGFGPFIAAGPIMGALAGAGAGGAVGGLVGAFVGVGIPEYEAKRYDGRVREGGILLSVHCDDALWTRLAKEILHNSGAGDISDTAESHADFAQSDKPKLRTRTGGSGI